jgi:hypothetical protein
MSIQTSHQRLSRLRSLRLANAPKWIIKSEQVALVLNHCGLNFTGIGKPCSKAQSELMTKHVTPLME